MGIHVESSKSRLAVLKERAKAEESVNHESGDEDANSGDSTSEVPRIVKINYTNVPVDIPEDFLAPLRDPDNTLEVKKIDWKKTLIPEYKKMYAVVMDNVLDEQECKQLIHMAERSAGGHCGDESAPNNGWKPAMVSAGRNLEFMDTSYRNSDRIIWDNQEVITRIWTRILQGKGMKEYFSVLQGQEYKEVIGWRAAINGDRYVISEKGPNERMRFLKYGAGQYFRRESYYYVPLNT
jgi:hypothetical protein